MRFLLLTLALAGCGEAAAPGVPLDGLSISDAAAPHDAVDMPRYARPCADAAVERRYPRNDPRGPRWTVEIDTSTWAGTVTPIDADAGGPQGVLFTLTDEVLAEHLATAWTCGYVQVGLCVGKAEDFGLDHQTCGGREPSEYRLWLNDVLAAYAHF